jgi:hypothetical protein
VRQKGLKVNGNDAIDERENDQDRFEHEVMMYEFDIYVAEQEALPEHQRDGYAERMTEQADMRRKEIRENGL